MNRPDWKYYDTPDNGNVITYGTKLDMYYTDLEKYCNHIEAVLHKIIEDKVADELFNIQCHISPEDFDKLVEKRFNKLIQENIDVDYKTYKVYNIAIGDSNADNYFPTEVLEDMITDKEVQECIKANALLVEYGNFGIDAIDISLVCAKVKKLYLMPDGLYADLLILDTPFGKKLQNNDFSNKVKLNILCTYEKESGNVKNCRLGKLYFTGD